MNAEQTTPFEGWCILELMGHRRLAGYVREVTLAGAGFLRLDVPAAENATAATQLYPPSSVYCLTPVTEEIARSVARTNRPEPVHRWELALPASTSLPRAPHDDEDEDYEIATTEDD